MSNTILYKNIVCPFRWVSNDLQVFYKKTWITVDIKDIKPI
jgi:hypothetical protein